MYSCFIVRKNVRKIYHVGRHLAVIICTKGLSSYRVDTVLLAFALREEKLDRIEMHVLMPKDDKEDFIHSDWFYVCLREDSSKFSKLLANTRPDDEEFPISIIVGEKLHL